VAQRDDDAAGPEPRRGLLSIGPFSRVAGLTIKTLRLYDDKGLLPPSFVDSSSGYRYYSTADLERARLIAALRGLDFSLAEIEELLGGSESAGVLPFLEAHRKRIADRRARLRRVDRELDRLIRAERDASARRSSEPESVAEADLPPLRVAGLRWRGAYAETGRTLGRVCRRYGRHAVGPPLNLYYDLEYKDEDADIESAIPIGDGREHPGFSVHTLSPGRAATLVHVGPYAEIGSSYRRLLTHLADRGLAPGLPIREIYLVGPGLLFKGDPGRYRTEIQVPIG
jgi:DNA-binding transcriptional MerR regulator